MNFIKPVCSTCGSDDVRADAYAVWDFPSQEWRLATTFDKGAVCENCGGETALLDKPLDGAELHEARAHKMAVDHGWLPGDEDTALEFCEGGGLDYTKPVPGEVTP